MKTDPYAQNMPSSAPKPAPHWTEVMVSLIRQEIDQGRLVRIAMPGARVPILIEDACTWAGMLVIEDPQGGRYYSGDPAGLVILAEPVQPRDPNEKPYWMKVDE